MEGEGIQTGRDNAALAQATEFNREERLREIASRDISRIFNSDWLGSGCGRRLGLFRGRLGFGPSRLAGRLGRVLQSIVVSEPPPAFLDFIVLLTHEVSPFL
jgi:hypothetical protein